MLIGPGDDAALLTVTGRAGAISTDMFVQDRHFRLDWSSPHDIGRKAIAQNAADIEAMGCSADSVSWSRSAHRPTPRRARSPNFPMACGPRPRAAAERAIIGGDLVSSPQWVISVTVLGDLDGRRAVERAAPDPGASSPWPVNSADRPPDTLLRAGRGEGADFPTLPPPPGARAALRSGPAWPPTRERPP